MCFANNFITLLSPRNAVIDLMKRNTLIFKKTHSFWAVLTTKYIQRMCVYMCTYTYMYVYTQSSGIFRLALLAMKLGWPAGLNGGAYNLSNS